MSEQSTPVRPRKRRRFGFAQLAAERRRATISFAVGLIVLLLLRIPAVEQSFLGAPDRQAMDWAFKLRADVVGGTAEPVLFVDFDDRTLSQLAPRPSAFALPLATTPDTVIVELLEFIRSAPPASAPRVVVVDLDIAQPSPDGVAGVARLKTALAAWAATPSAPPLILERDSYSGALLGMSDRAQVLPDTPYDSVVKSAPNKIFWATTTVLGDRNGIIREFLPFECVLTSSGIQPLYSAALLAYQSAERDRNALARGSASHWLRDAAGYCQSHPYAPLKRGERIDYHLSLTAVPTARGQGALDPGWPGFEQCANPDPTVFRQLSAIEIIAPLRAGGDVSRGLLCQHVVILGGTNSRDSDLRQAPVSEMNGSVILANAIRGLELSHGGLRPVPLIFQVLLLALVSLAISAAAAATQNARHRYRRLRRSPHKDRLGNRLSIILLNPIILNGIITIAAGCIEIGLLMISLGFGFWGFLSAPVFAAAITETVQEFADG